MKLSKNAKKDPNVFGIGNTETIPNQTKTSKKFCFTLLNYTKTEYDHLCAYFNINSTRYVFGREICPNTKTLHLQGAFHTDSRLRLLTCKNKIGINRLHIEFQRGSDNESFNYCMKDGDFISKGIEKPYLGADLPKFEKLYDWELNILNIIKSPKECRTVHWFWEKTGNVGKTTFTKYLMYNHNACVINKGKYADIMNHAFNCINLEVFVIDIPRCIGNKVSYDAIESIKSGIIVNTKYETGQKLINSPYVIVFSNEPPDTDKLSKDRWNIVEIGV